MPRWLKHLVFFSLLVVFGGCAGSCSGCSSCGVTPIKGGFSSSHRIENATSIRLTQSGLQFLSQNVGPLATKLLGTGSGSNGVLTFDIPHSHTSTTVGYCPICTHINIDACTNGPKPNANPMQCIAEIGLGNSKLTITTAAPHDIKISGTLPVRVQDIPVDTSVGSVCASLENGSGFVNVPLNVDVSLQADTVSTHGSRTGYTIVKIKSLSVDQTTLENNINFGCGTLGSILDIGFVKSFIAGQFIGPLTQALQGQIDSALCMSADPTTGVTCPTGSTADSSGVCKFSDGSCVQTLLGTDGHLDLGAALASLSPGTQSALDFVAALGGADKRNDGSGMHWGDLNPIHSGMTVGMYGGVEPSPTTTCVPIAKLPLPTGIPIPGALLGNTVSGWPANLPGPHVGIAVSERYMDYALASVYNSGALCLGIGQSTFGSLLNSGTLGLLMPSFKDLARQRESAPVAMVLRPQSPPTVVVGNGTDLKTDPLLKVSLNKLLVDVYVFSSDRYIRAFTASLDIVVPVNLDVDANSTLTPDIQTITVNNPVLFNAPLIRENLKTAATTLAGIVSSLVGSKLAGAIPPIDLNSSIASYGLKLQIPPTQPGQGSPGLRKLTAGSDNFLGIFASLAMASGPTHPLLRSTTEAQVEAVHVDPAGLSLPTLTRSNVPTVDIHVSSPLDTGAQSIEYQYRVDGGFWHPWTTERYITVRSPLFSLQARHTIDVRSRIVGQPSTVDVRPTRLTVLIDKTPPNVKVASRPREGRLALHVSDLVSPPSAIDVRWSFDKQPFSSWVNAAKVTGIPVASGAKRVQVQARDESGNIGTTSQALIRGRVDQSLAPPSSCNCRVPGGGTTPRGGLKDGLGALLALGLALGLRRRRPASGRRAQRRRPRSGRRAQLRRNSVRAFKAIGSISLMAIAASWSGCSCGATGKSNAGSGGSSGDAGQDAGCQCADVEPGLVGAYSSVAVAGDGTVWVAGYDDIGYTKLNGAVQDSYLFGDLDVGKWDGSKVAWQAVDGLPSVDPSLQPGTPGGPPDPTKFNVNGFRGGLTDPGDDVGLWTSIALNSRGLPRVAYYDATHRALKYASFDGQNWTVQTVQQDPTGDDGRYAKLVLVNDAPVIAYLSITAGASGQPAQSAVRIATASTPNPASAGDWTFKNIAVNKQTPCRAYMCAQGQVCRGDTFVCDTPTTGCSPSCASGQSCFTVSGSPTCVTAITSSYLDDYPDAAGLYISMVPTPSGLGLIYYDRLHGNLIGVNEQSGTWSTPMVLAGQVVRFGTPVDTGDDGIGSSLFIDSNGDWNLSYVSGINEALMYMKVTGGTQPTKAEVVDNGRTDAGLSIVGDDSNIFVQSSGQVDISYQDATQGLLRWATGTPSSGGSGHTWTRKTLSVDGFAGAFSHIVTVNGAQQVLTWWRKAKPNTVGDVTLVTP